MGAKLVDHVLEKPVDLLASYETADFLERLAERYKAATKAMIAAGGPVKYGDREIRTTETINPPQSNRRRRWFHPRRSRWETGA